MQKHICRLKGEHLPGMQCLSDEQLIEVLLACDTSSLLNCGRASPRLYRLVCDRHVWPHLLKGVDLNKKEQVKELRIFMLGLFGMRGCHEMMAEVMKEAARRCPVFKLVKVTISIWSWDPPETFEVDGKDLDELYKVADSFGRWYDIVSVEDHETRVYGGLINLAHLTLPHLARQKRRMEKVKLTKVNLSLPGARDAFYDLQKASHQWSVENFILYKRRDCKILARISGQQGSISTLHLRVRHRLPRFGRLGWHDDFKKIWSISDKVVFRLMYSDSPDVELGGGKDAEDREGKWQRMLEVVFAA